MRRAQLLGHIIVFIIGLLVVSGVILFGYRVLQNLEADRCEVAEVQFATELAGRLEKNKDWGVDRPETFSPPCDTRMICFIDRRIIDAKANTGSLSTVGYQGPLPSVPNDRVLDVILSSIESLVPANVFIVRTDFSTEPVGRFSAVAAPVKITDEGSTVASIGCFDATDQLQIRMQGDGAMVRVSDVG